MSDSIEERYMRFHALYVGVFKEPFDVDEFIADDLYAFQAFERALRSENQTLRNMAAHLQVERQEAIESITLTPMQALEKTRKLKLLESGDAGAPQELQLEPLQTDPPPMAPLQLEPLQAESSQAQPPKAQPPQAQPSQAQPPKAQPPQAQPPKAQPPQAAPPPAAPAPAAEHHRHSSHPSAAEVSLLSDFQSLYKKKFGSTLDLGKLMNNMEYGQKSLKDAMASGDAALIKAAKAYAAERAKRQLAGK
ncbi:MAG TPA: hypothetical protein VH105_18965 [Burkholderiales bacterium]|nr:hypothetical protein [Burkholderiales bacterium]